MASLIGRFIRMTSFLVAFFVVILPASLVSAAPYAAYVMDARTGETLYSKNADTRLHPASLTKMMTLYIAFEEIAAGRLSLDDKVTVSKHAAGQPPSRLGLKQGQKIALRYLIRAAAVKSANDAATAIGEHIGNGSEAAFAKRMTRTAKALGMANSTFRNANGLTAEGHMSTAHDMSILGRRLFYDFPQFYNIFSRRSADAGIAQVNSTNRRFLDAYEGADGIKTGYTSPAGFNLTASAQRGNKRIIATVFGGASTADRNAKVMKLLDLGFGEAKGKVIEEKPAAPEYDNDAEMVLAENAIDQTDAPGGAAKTIRVSGEVKTSLRPKSRPGVADPAAEVPQEVDIALAAGIEGALAEATAAPAPEGTLEAQAEDLAGSVTETEALDDAALDGDDALAVAEITPEASVPQADTDAAVALALTETTTPAEGTLEAQALALASGEPETVEATPVDANTLEAQAIAMTEQSGEGPAEPGSRPKSRPETLEAPVAVAAATPEAAVVPEAETVVAEQTAIEPATEMVAEVSPETPIDLAEVTAVETVAGATNTAPAKLASNVANLMPAKRKAPIYDKVAEAPQATPTEDAEVVVRVSTSGGRHFGVNVGKFTSRSEAERALFKLALAESATLNQGLRKITEKGGAYRANFMGLTEDQADLACRRLRARAVECETLGS